MPSTGTSVARKIVADALRLNWSGLEVRFALRCTAGVALPLIISAFFNQPLAGASAAYGALITGFASRQGVYVTRIIAMLGGGAAIALSGFAGAVTGPYPVLNIALLALWSLCFGVTASLGRTAIVLATNACVAFVIFSNAPYDASNPALQACALFGGCILQTTLLVLVWPLTGFGTERAALAASFAALAQYANGLRADDLGLPEGASLVALNTTLADPQPFGGRGEVAAYQALADEAERLRGTLAALATDQHLLNEVGLSAIGEAVRSIGLAVGPLLEEASAAVGAGRVPVKQPAELHALEEALRALDALCAPSAPYVADARALAGQVRAALRLVEAAATGGIAPGDAPVRTARWDFNKYRIMAGLVWANFSWDSMYARHALRLTAALTIAVIAQHLLELQHAQWIALTVILVLRPDFASTFTRGVGRVAGTVGGAIFASIVAAFHPNDASYIFLAVAFAGLGFALFNVSYALFSASITGYVVYMLAFGGAPEHASAMDRVVATILGGFLAIVAYAAWPAWSRSRVGDDLAAHVDASRRYLNLVLHALAEAKPDTAALRDAQMAALRARSNAEASVDQMAGEPVTPRGISLRSAAGILAAMQRLAIGVYTLQTRVARTTGANADVDHLAVDLDVALLSIVTALHDGEAPAPLPPLRDDQIVLQRILDERRDPAVEVLASETDLIVDSVNTIAAILARTSTTAA